LYCTDFVATPDGKDFVLEVNTLAALCERLLEGAALKA